MDFSCKRKLYRFLLLMLLGCLTLLSFYQWNFIRSDLQIREILKYNNVTNVLSISKGMKYILIWTNADRSPLLYWGRGQGMFNKLRCKVDNCYVTGNRSFFPSIAQFDAVAFSSQEITTYVTGPERRSPHQKYVFISMESSHYYPINNKRYDGYFNWTWTYKLDSDISLEYITIKNITGDIVGPNKIMHWIKQESMQSINHETKKRLKKKNKAAAWFVSNCNSLSKRDVFARNLQKELKKYGLQIDIFGKCGSKKCPWTKTEHCLKMVQEDYYFYLSLENSFSEDYVTEKLLTALQNYAIPVVFGGANYTRFMPDGIYLNGGEVRTSVLAKTMSDIIKDKQRYYNFFKWRNHYSYHHKHVASNSNNLCRTCEMLHDQRLMKKTTVYKDFRKWWNEDARRAHIRGYLKRILGWKF